MNKLSLIDTHCDTAFELYHRKQSLYGNSCHIDLEKAEKYKSYAQFFAIWADKRKSDDECYSDFLRISDNLFSEIDKNSDRAAHVKSFGDTEKAFGEGKRAIFLAVEDARILANDIIRLDELKARGVGYLTLLWGGETCIGASHDTEGGLTDFGKAVVKRCFEVGIVPDVSHANIAVTDYVADMAYQYKKPFMASHSNCYRVYNHTRNLQDEHIKAIIDLGGAIGLNLCRFHICDAENDTCNIDSIIRHIEGFLSLGAENVLGLGCDMDGAPLPDGIGGIGDLDNLAVALENKGYSSELINKIFFENHFGFIKRCF